MLRGSTVATADLLSEVVARKGVEPDTSDVVLEGTSGSGEFTPWDDPAD